MYEVFCSTCNSPHLNGSLPGDGLAKSIKSGKEVWIPEAAKGGDEEEGSVTATKWSKASVISRCGSVATLRIKERLRVIDLAKEERLEETLLPANDKVVEDMTELHFTHEPGILANLEARALAKKPYTFIGNVLVSINPVRKVPEPTEMDNSPHPWTVADRAFRRMSFSMSQAQIATGKVTRSETIMSDESVQGTMGKGEVPFGREYDIMENMNQTVLISGESGSGKTEAAKRVLVHLVNRETFKDYGMDDNPDLLNLQHKILGSDPILEVFGNAKTQKNHNSSRFGKFLKLYYEVEEEYPDNLVLGGASITTYLLERSRVTRQMEGERNFRVFYQLLTNTSTSMSNELGFTDASFKFRYLGNVEIDRSELSKTGYLELRSSLRMARLSVKSMVLYEVVAAVLHIGNIDFVAEQTKEGEVSAIPKIRGQAYNPFEYVRKLLMVDKATLKRLLCEKRVVIGNERVKKRYDVRMSTRIRDAIAKHVYSLLFEWVVFELNRNMQGEMFDNVDGSVASIGILDVFGFERFKRNGFEQLLINYANEILLSLFTEQVLVGELEIYKTEGLIIGEKDFMNVETTSVESRQCLELFNGLPSKRNKKGLFAVLESQGRTLASTERGFFKELKKTIRKYPAYGTPHPSERYNSFIVKHYAGPVKYTVGDFVEKNDDSLPEEVELLFKSSKHQIVSSFARLHAARRDKAMARQQKMFTRSRRNPSLSNAFTVQINELANELSKSGCHYIRCVKPNPTLYFGINEGGLSSLSNNEQVIDEPETRKHILGNRLKGGRKSGSESKRRNSFGFTRVGKLALVYDSTPFTPKNGSMTYFDRSFVSNQLRTLGIYDAVRVLKSGLPTRLPYDAIIETFKEFIPKPSLRLYLDKNLENKQKLILQALLWSFKVSPDTYRLGNTRVFFGNGELEKMKTVLSSAVRWKQFPKSKEKIRIMKRFKRYYWLRIWRRGLIKVVAQNAFLRMLKAMRAAKLIQRTVRLYWIRCREQRIQTKAVIVIQQQWRGFAARRRCRAMIAEKIAEERAKRELVRRTKVQKLQRLEDSLQQLRAGIQVKNRLDS